MTNDLGPKTCARRKLICVNTRLRMFVSCGYPLEEVDGVLRCPTHGTVVQLPARSPRKLKPI